MTSKRVFLILSSLIFAIASSAHKPGTFAKVPAETYSVIKLKQPITIDGVWSKPQWEAIQSVSVNKPIINKPFFVPEVEAKMAYDDTNIYVIFRVNDRYVKSLTTTINGPVWKDSAVEFFFSPDTTLPLKFFNLEVNCGGTALLSHKGVGKIDSNDIQKIEIAHSLPRVVDPEITDPIVWVLEMRIPLDVLEKYSNIARPGKGVSWRANFYKIAEITSNPHYLSWSEIQPPARSFHSPESFGVLRFQ